MIPPADRSGDPSAARPGVRAAVAGDAAAIAVLEAELFPDAPWSEAQVLEELTGYGRRGWVLEGPRSGVSPTSRSIQVEPASGPVAGPVAGYVLMRTVGEVSDLQRIGVAPTRQRAGLAAALLAVASAGVREEGAERILLEVAEDNVAARAFYAREGFVEIDRRAKYYRHEVDALVLQRELAQ